MLSKTRLGVLVSGGGTNLQAIIDSCKAGILKEFAEVAVVISNKSDAYALIRARRDAIEAIFLDKKKFADPAAYYSAMAGELKKRSVDLVCLAGFLLKLDSPFIRAFPKRIVNIHPALLPKYGGKGMYGHFVHEAVLANKERESGATVHWVDEEYDRGPIIIQERVPVIIGDTPDILAKRVLEVEHKIYPIAIKNIIIGGLS